jgi:4-hydroxy-tetrahydrodipicolinate synthase
MRPYEGLLTAMVTPFDAAGRVDEEAAVALGRHLLANGSDGLVIAGSTGEAATLSDEEHIGLVALIAGELGAEGTVVAGAGSNDTRHAIELSERSIGAGAHALLSVTGYYNKPNARGVRRHFEAVAGAVAGAVPIIVYNIPSRTGINIPPELLEELGRLDGIEAVKQSNNDDLGPIEGLAVLAGNDDALARNLDLGGAGGICVASQIAGPRMKAMFGASPQARAEIHAELTPLFEVLFSVPSPACTKAALRMLGHDVGGLRLPLVECDEAEEAAVRDVLAGIGLLEGAASP